MEIINSKRHKDFVQDLREILNQTQMISYEIKNKEIKNKLSEIVIPNFIEVISYVEVHDLRNVNLNYRVKTLEKKCTKYLKHYIMIKRF